MLDQLKMHTTVVADTADFYLIKEYAPEDATTNPSLVLAGTKLPQYQHLLDQAIHYANNHNTSNKVECAVLKLTVNFGCEILKLIPGRVSTEVDAKYSFDIEKSVENGREIIRLYEEMGFNRSRIYIKLASTWEGIQAAKILENEGICCNLTLLFSFEQAVACAQASVSLISPFVGRIMDWYRAKQPNQEGFEPTEDPGVLSVTRIYNYYKAYDYKTIVMGASFRNIGQIVELCGCDKLTISPTLLKQLNAENQGTVVRKLSPEIAKKTTVEPMWDTLTQSAFLMGHNENQMAVEKLSEGLRSFNKDMRLLEAIVAAKF